MISSIGSAAAAQAPVVQARTGDTAVTTAATQADTTTTAADGVETQSALSSATARVGDALQAQADAARVQRAVDEGPPAPPAEPDDSEETGAAAGAQGAARGGGGGARPAGAAPGETASADYIAEADTNADKKVSDQERIAYEKKLERQAEAGSPGAATDQSQALRQAYGLAGETASALSTTA